LVQRWLIATNDASCLATLALWKGGRDDSGWRGVGQRERKVRSMPVPSSNLVQFTPPGGEFFVDVITDPGGAPATILDVDQGFQVTGRVTLPNWLSGKGQVCVYADELGGPIDEKLSPCAEIAIRGKTGEPGSTVYPWSITFPGNPPVLPDP